MAYSLGIRCLSEFLGMMIVIYTGEAALANELLPSTKVCAGLTGTTAPATACSNCATTAAAAQYCHGISPSAVDVLLSFGIRSYCTQPSIQTQNVLLPALGVCLQGHAMGW
jgi:hypothetical protein